MISAFPKEAKVITKSKKYKLKSGEIVDLISEHDDKIVIMFNGTCFERPAGIIGTLLFPVSDGEAAKADSAAQKFSTDLHSGKAGDRPQPNTIKAGDTVCLKFIEMSRKSVFTISEDNSDVTVSELLCSDEGVISNDSPLAKELLGEKSGSVITFYYKDKIFVVKVLSFFKKTTGVYQQMREQKEAQKALDEQRKKNEKLAKSSKRRVRSIKTGNTVCVEFLDTNEKKAFKIVEAWLLVTPDAAVKPYRPTTYDSKTMTDADPDNDTISETSPLARALIGRTRGEIVKYNVADKTISVRIIAFFEDDTWLKNQKN